MKESENRRIINLPKINKNSKTSLLIVAEALKNKRGETNER